ncbi:FecR family protein [Asticcacaulis excentricus]|uniref:Anti-FecI sigma factor, FecR n=1 Tax=Asticcacaulis excentricus (strain ATCC 15261 / DSM 4724 / KCTC 12464 / NCIMB 9791 / VKM B-1370 / CB 48) TaxID=573065 RepID=E8RMD8_ASTEC|nr:DUF4880 domain-containing protein [Asticcacaulis excentricus]ADU13889.1 anti-FecI sigma factor, FecR [Asticcacaulis excentricus CB 48]
MNGIREDGVDKPLEEAATWYARLQADEAELPAFEAWRGSHPKNAVAFAKIVAANESLRADQVKGVDRLALYPLWTRRNLYFVLGLLGALILFSLMGYLLYFRSRGRSDTKQGEVRMLALAQNLNVELNTKTRIKWQASARAVQLTLQEGEVFIRQAPGAIVCRLMCQGRIVVLSAGEYLARLNGQTLDLLVLKGEAEIPPKGSERAVVRLHPQQSVLLGSDLAAPRTLSVSQTEFRTGWRQGYVDLDGQILSEVVAEYNRYLEKPIRIADPEIGDLRLAGRFSLKDPKPFLEGLRQSFGLNVVGDEEGYVISR